MNNYVMPDYYNKFRCKTGECRQACCQGWTVSITLNEYFKIVNLDCDEKFREKLDQGFYINLRPENDHYATIRKNYYGDCVFHGCDGLCEIHKNFGEKAIPSVCNFYPRNISKEYALEKSCSNSCEKVLELLFENTNPLQFVYEKTNDEVVNYLDEYNICRKRIINTLQNRELPLEERLNKISLQELEIEFDITKTKKSEEIINTLLDYLKLYVDQSSVALDFIELINDSDIINYDNYLKHLYEVIPNFDIYLEKYIVNHVFFTGFPYDKLIGKYDYFIHSLVGVYMLTKIITVFMMKSSAKERDAVDAIAKLYRLIGHSNFHKNIGKYLYKTDKDTILQMVK